MNKYLKNLLFFTVFFALIFSFFADNVYALGIGPARVIIDFEPNLKETFSYIVLNNENKTLDVEMYVKGDLEDYVTLHTTSTTLSPGETKTFTYEINLPSKLEKPGTYDTRIGALELPPTIEGQGATVGARVGVESQLWIRVPYPGKYIEISLDAPNVKVGDPVDFVISVLNLGKEDVIALGSIDVYDTNNIKLTTLSTGSEHVKTGATGKLYAQWTTKNIKPGSYRAVARVIYNGNPVETEKNFRVGELLININNIYADKIKQETIGKINIEIESFWNEKISGVYVEVNVAKQTIKSETTDVGAWEKKTINIYWDTKGVDIGSYKANAILYYADKITSKEFTLEVVSAESSLISALFLASPTASILWTIIVIILISLLLYLYKRRKKSGRWAF